MAWVPAAIAAGSALMDKFGGDQNQMQKVPTMNRGQRGLLRQLMQMLGPQGGLGQGMQEGIGLQRQYLDPSSQAVEQFSQPYMNQFNQQTIPGLAERFAGLGALGGGLSSSGFGQALGAAGGNLQTQLAALKAGLGQQAAQSLMGQYGSMAGMGLGAQPFAYQQQAPSMLGGMMQGWAQGGFGGSKEIGDSLTNLFNSRNNSYQTKFPLTSSYDSIFRMGGLP